MNKPLMQALEMERHRRSRDDHETHFQFVKNAFTYETRLGRRAVIAVSAAVTAAMLFLALANPAMRDAAVQVLGVVAVGMLLFLMWLRSWYSTEQRDNYERHARLKDEELARHEQRVQELDDAH